MVAKSDAGVPPIQMVRPRDVAGPVAGAAVATGQARRERHARLDFLDALRGIAALAVVAQHIGTGLSADFTPFAQRYFDFGEFGVVLFFLCSGFIIPASLERGAGLRDFWLGRFFRLYPLYWASIFGVLALASAGRLPLPRGFLAEPRATLLANLTMFQSFVDRPGLLVAYWTLGFEMLFYLVMSALFLVRLHRQTLLLALPLLILPIADRALALVMDRASEGQYLRLMTTLGTMCVGTVAYRYVRGQIAAPVAAIVLAMAPLATYAAFGDYAQAGGLLSWQAAYLLFVLALLFRHRPVPRGLVAVGTISYSIYLTNPLIVAALPRLSFWPISIAAWLIAIFVLSAATYRWIEQPAMLLGARLRAHLAKARA